MPTHADKMDKTGGVPPCLVHLISMCWHSVGMPQLGHLLVRPGVLNISSIFNYFDIISYISYIVPTAPILQIQVFSRGCDMEFGRSSGVFSRFFHHKFEIP